MTNPAAQAEHLPAAHEIEIEVNKRPARVPARTTGAAVKAAAGVPADDQLFRIDGEKEFAVGDSEHIEVHPGERFVATPPIEPA